MNYSSYSIDQLMDNKYYSEICNRFLSLATDEETQKKLESILYKGGYGEYSFSTDLSNKDNPSIELRRRISMAYLLVNNPATFDYLVDNKINVFHGTNANALPGIIKYGVRSAKDSLKNGVEVVTGEKSTMFHTRSFISFTDVLDIAEDYSTLPATTDNELYSFEVVVGITKSTVEKLGHKTIFSDVSEIGIPTTVVPEDISVLLVPSDKVDFVRKMTNGKIKVLAVDNINEKFYFVDDFYRIYFNEEKYQSLKNGEPKSNYELTGVKETVLSRTATSIKEHLNKFKELLQGKDDEDVRKSRL